MSIKKKFYICLIFYAIISAIFVYLINNNNFYYKVYEKKLIYETNKLLNDYKINNNPLKLTTKKELLENVQIKKYKIFEKNYLLLKLSEYDFAINSKIFTEKKDNFIIISLKSKDQKDNELLKQKINELIINETIYIINNIKAASFNNAILTNQKKLNDVLTQLNKNIRIQYIQNPKKLEINVNNNLIKSFENINFEINKVRSIIIDNNINIKLFAKIDPLNFDIESETSKIVNKCLDNIGEDLNKDIFNENLKSLALFKILSLRELCNHDHSKIIEKKIYSLNSNEFEILKKIKSFNEQVNQLKKIKINLNNLKELNILESEITNYFNLLELLFGIQLELAKLTKEIKKSESSLNNSNEYDIEYFNLKHEKWKIITIFLILNFLLIYLFIYRKLENLIKIIR
tara:strand:+ start:6583 stop:7791 length:1209 start_codon:yes stop_codon:yes gene_type:complete